MTGTRGPELDETRKNVDTIRTLTKLPVVVGFGVSTPEQARQIGSMADGVVVGSAFVKLIGEKAGKPGNDGCRGGLRSLPQGGPALRRCKKLPCGYASFQLTKEVELAYKHPK